MGSRLTYSPGGRAPPSLSGPRKISVEDHEVGVLEPRIIRQPLAVRCANAGHWRSPGR